MAAGAAHRLEIQLAFAIGVADPVSIQVDSFGTGALPDEEVAAKVREVFDFKPQAIIERLGLRNPIFTPTAAYGHFGRTPEVLPLSNGGEADFFTWERTDRIDDVRQALGL